MGVKDQGLQEYLKDNERFADFVNGTLFAGKQIVDPRYLKEVQRKKSVSYELPIAVNDIQKKNSSEKDGEEETAVEKGASEENCTRIMYLERERDFFRLFVDEKVVEVKDMCEAWDGAMQMYADEAREATRKEMKKEMKKEVKREVKRERRRIAKEKDRRTVFNMFSRGYSQAEIAAVSELPLGKVKKMCKEFSCDTEIPIHMP